MDAGTSQRAFEPLQSVLKCSFRTTSATSLDLGTFLFSQILGFLAFGCLPHFLKALDYSCHCQWGGDGSWRLVVHFCFHFFTLTIAAIFSYEPLSNLLMVWTHVPNYITHRPRSADGTALRLLPKDCRKQRLKSGGVAVCLIAWFTVLGALGLLPKDC
ncbi:hypothetical protein ACFX2H_036627 [Malus domestica]